MRKQFRFNAAALAVPTLLCVAASTLSATTVINGTLNINGSVSVSALGITNSGVFNVVVPGTGYFAGLATTPASVAGTEVDLTAATPPPPLPVGFFVDNFLTNFRFIATGLPVGAPYTNLHFDLKDIPTPSAPACVGDGTDTNCTQGLFQLVQIGPNQTLIGLKVVGFFEDTNVVCNGTPVPVGCTSATGIYSTQIPLSIAGIKTTIVGGGTIDAAFSANFISSAVPEPGTLESVFLGGLLLSISLFTRKRAQKS